MRKILRGKIPLSLVAFLVCAVAFTGMMFTEDLRALTEEKEKENQPGLDHVVIDEDKTEFNPTNAVSQKASGSSTVPMSHCILKRIASYIERQIACSINGRPDKDYLHWVWELDGFTLPRFNAKFALRKLRGKRMMFVGDSLQRGQWESFICLVQAHIPEDQKSMNRRRQIRCGTQTAFTGACLEYQIHGTKYSMLICKGEGQMDNMSF